MTPPGARSCTVHVRWPDEEVVYPAVLDPRWTTTQNMTTTRQGHTATLLSTGNVLVVGGTSNGSTALASAELYNRTTGTWAATNPMTGARTLHSATQLGSSSNGTTSGKVLISGGLNGTTSQNTAQLYSPTAGTWTAAANLNAARHGHTATLLVDGRVLVTGGLNGTTTLNTAALYNPASGTGSWVAAAGILPSALKNHAAALLTTTNNQLSNKVLVFGGNSGSATVSGVYLFDPAQNAFSTQTSLPSAREGHTVTVLANGNLLVTGGKSGTTTLATTVLFNPSSGAGSWSSSGTMNVARQAHSATLIPTAIVSNGQVLVAGGSSGSATLSSAELWNGTTWALTTALLSAQQGHTATLLGNDAILIAGGVNGSTTVGAAQLYDASFGVACTLSSQCVTGFCVNGVCCDSACNNGCGACNLSGKVGTCSAVAAGTVCRASAGSCDVAETCSGTSTTCPANAFAPSTTVCRASAGACDVAENCTGSSATCPADGFQSTSTVCRASAGVCDVAENCPGTSAACPANGFKSSATVCRPSAGACDVAENCPGTSAACPADGFLAATTVCRPVAGGCDIAESCTGTSATCPPDRVMPVDSICRPSAGPCDVPELCGGVTATCAPDQFQPAGTVCRAAAGVCDVAETCSGTSVTCPADGFLPRTTVCRPVAGNCDVAENCTGSAATCPADAKAPNGSLCDDGNACTAGDTCQSAVCVGGPPVTCPTADQCHTGGGGTCNPTTGCPAASPVADGAVCSDGNSCTQGETCQGGTCQTDRSFALLVNVPVNDLGNLGGSSSTAQGVSIGPDVVGTSTTATGQQHAFVSFGGGQPLFDISAQPGAPAPSTGTAINDTDMVVGSLPQPDGSSHVFSRTDATGVVDLGPVGDNSVATDTFAFQGGYAYAVNNSGQIAGVNTDAGQFRGFLYTSGTGFEDIGSLDGLSSWLFGLSDSGAAVGASLVPGAPTTGFERFGHAVLFNAATELVDLNNYVDPTSGLTLTLANGISGNYIVGGADLKGTALPFRLNTSTGTVDHFNGGWQGSSVASSVNSMGDTVGWGFMAAGDTQQSAFIYTDGIGFKNLNDVIDPSLGWNLQVATGINERDDVVGWGYHNGVVSAFMLRVSPETVACQSNTTCGGTGTGLCVWSDGVVANRNGTFTAVFGFSNGGTTSITPTTNTVIVDGSVVLNPNPAPPELLPPGAHPGVFLPVINAGQTIIWNLNGQVVTASADSTRDLPTTLVGTTGESVAVENTQVTVKADLGPYQTPPAAITQAADPQVGAPYYGSLSGKLDVSPTGASLYTLPLTIPKGTAGMAPSLSLVYSSQGGNGIMGQGWSLSGLSMIYVCSQTLASDGQSVPYGLVANPNLPNHQVTLCLDGQRLFQRQKFQSSDPNSVAGTYQLETNDFSGIEYDDGSQTPNGPAFTVTTKSGEIRHYGLQTYDTLAVPADHSDTFGLATVGTRTVVWLLDRVEDPWANYYDIVYNNKQGDFSTNGIAVTEIDYTGHLGKRNGRGPAGTDHRPPHRGHLHLRNRAPDGHPDRPVRRMDDTDRAPADDHQLSRGQLQPRLPRG